MKTIGQVLRSSDFGKVIDVKHKDKVKDNLKSGYLNAKKLFNPSKMKGIGEYEESLASSKNGRRALCIAKIAFDILVVVAATYGVYVGAVFSPPSLIITIPLHLLISLKAGQNLWSARIENRGLKNLAPSTHTLIPKTVDKQCIKLEKWDTTPMKCHAFSDSTETFKCKKELIKNAEQEILLSGSYCGRKAFDEVLDLIDDQMAKKPNLKVHILTATRFMTDQDKFGAKNWKKVKELTAKYPDRFFTVLTFETEQANPVSGYKYISNHTKLMVVDRKAMITGGSGIEDRWAYTNGLEAYAKYNDTGIVNSSIAKTFRDKDFLVTLDDENQSSDKKGAIERSALEFFKLMTRWNHYDQTRKKDHSHLVEMNKKRGVHRLNDFHNFYAPINENEARIDLDAVKEHLEEGRDNCEVNGVKVFMSGPEQQDNMLEEALVRLIDGAQQRITINHMYFHPTSRVLEALRKALLNGVDVTILTNAKSDVSPNSHSAFGPRSVYHARDLARTKGISGSLKLYYWDVKSSTNHQKMVMVDGKYTLCGSSNFGFKGLDSMSDYEHNLLIDSEDLCQQLEDDFNTDLNHSKEYDQKILKKRPTWREYLSALVHIHFQAKIG